uniref:Uncharacterized protein n=1 Tax=Glossina austeni TaxID=7395 RepID=A0A1A9VXZ8_GLOAU
MQSLLSEQSRVLALGDKAALLGMRIAFYWRSAYCRALIFGFPTLACRSRTMAVAMEVRVVSAFPTIDAHLVDRPLAVGDLLPWFCHCWLDLLGSGICNRFVLVTLAICCRWCDVAYADAVDDLVVAVTPLFETAVVPQHCLWPSLSSQ